MKGAAFSFPFFGGFLHVSRSKHHNWMLGGAGVLSVVS